MLPEHLRNIVFKCVPFELQYLCLCKGITEMLLQYYMASFLIVWPCLKKFEWGPSDSCKIFRDKVTETLSLNCCFNRRCGSFTTTYHIQTFEKATIDKKFRKDFLNYFFGIFNFKTYRIKPFYLPTYVLACLINYMDEENANSQALMFFKHPDHRIFEKFIQKFPQCLNSLISEKVWRLIDFAVSYQQDAHRHISNEAKRLADNRGLERLIELGVDINLVDISSIYSLEMLHKLVSLGLSKHLIVKDAMESLEYIIPCQFPFDDIAKKYLLMETFAEESEVTDFDFFDRFWDIDHMDC